ncbi:hypothetical protein AB833_18085 [Chromatiales bacterium (ex Bugula neritina AB1)]|nr:hypothetical protein AB833_18085 [Chromatiales bacterium (ex Bugula neritina AB1)]
MELRISDIKTLQEVLQENGIYDKKIDGKPGPATIRGARTFLLAHENKLPSNYKIWSNKRIITACYQIIISLAGHEVGPVDGLYGPLTRNGSVWFIRQREGIETVDWEALSPDDINPNNFPCETTDALNSHYGTAKPPTSCPYSKIVQVPSPWKMGLDWNMTQSRSHFNVHSLVADSLKRILEAVFQHYGLEGIKKHGLNRFSGDHTCRNIRGGSRPSTHAWGIAIDFYGSRNELHRSTNDATPPRLAHPELSFFWEQWEKEGWYSLGRMEDRDWMHIQAAKGKRSKFFHT